MNSNSQEKPDDLRNCERKLLSSSSSSISSQDDTIRNLPRSLSLIDKTILDQFASNLYKSEYENRDEDEENDECFQEYLENNCFGSDSIRTILTASTKSFDNESFENNPLRINSSANDAKKLQILDESKQSSGSKLKCPICLSSNRKLFCASCIKNGDFTHSKNNFLERFADKKLKFIKLKEQQMQILNFVTKHFSNSVMKEKLSGEIKTAEKNVKILKSIIAEKRLIKNKIESLLRLTERDCSEIRRKTQMLNEKIEKTKHLIAKQSQSSKHYLKKENHYQNQLNDLMQNKIAALTTFIFPISEQTITSSSRADQNDKKINRNFNDSVSNETTPLLDCDTTNDYDDYDKNDDEDGQKECCLDKKSPCKNMIAKHQTTKKRSSEKNVLKIIEYRIVESSIRNDENLELITKRSSQSLDVMLSIDDNLHQKDYFRIVSSLSHLCHLTNSIANILCVHLPKKISLGEFTTKVLRKKELAHKIYKLNLNVVYLCVINRCDQNQIRPSKCFKNMLILLGHEQIRKFKRFLWIDDRFYKQIRKELLLNFKLNSGHLLKPKKLETIEEFDFIENNVPDLIFDNEQVRLVNYILLIDLLINLISAIL
ncbi:beclin 1-associated autophagy-related key regulator-like protein [Sarcoptes scabiei]|uniref:Beclin 1-associated autophagy-related key regulator-like protein n=1 Tax=Sarcoptes scabiei TaxID=52283 RepID=A0A132A7R8_SARSC|nr:beclin 1-associated autophagy-related key regulator-like protein [Sarcoptes scabiei]